MNRLELKTLKEITFGRKDGMKKRRMEGKKERRKKERKKKERRKEGDAK